MIDITLDDGTILDIETDDPVQANAAAWNYLTDRARAQSPTSPYPPEFLPSQKPGAALAFAASPNDAPAVNALGTTHTVAIDGGEDDAPLWQRAVKQSRLSDEQRAMLRHELGPDAQSLSDEQMYALLARYADEKSGPGQAALIRARRTLGDEGWRAFTAAKLRSIGRNDPKADFDPAGFRAGWSGLSDNFKVQLAPEHRKAINELDAVGRATSADGAPTPDPLAILQNQMGGNLVARWSAWPTAAPAVARWAREVSLASRLPSERAALMQALANRTLANAVAHVSGDDPAAIRARLDAGLPAEAMAAAEDPFERAAARRRREVSQRAPSHPPSIIESAGPVSSAEAAMLRGEPPRATRSEELARGPSIADKVLAALNPMGTAEAAALKGTKGLFSVPEGLTAEIDKHAGGSGGGGPGKAQIYTGSGTGRVLTKQEREAPYPGAKYPQFAEEYPPVGPPTIVRDPKTGKEFLSRQLTPEAEAFRKDHKRVIKEVREQPYTPYFDPRERFHADPKNYPPNVDTLAIRPVRQETIDKYLAKIDTPEVRERLRAAFKRGELHPDAVDFHAVGQLEKAFINEYGTTKGREAFRDRFAAGMAAATAGMDPRSNFLAMQYGNYLREHGMPMPAATHQLPYPIHGPYMAGNMRQMDKVLLDKGGFAALGEGNPKRHDYAQNLMGNPWLAAIDSRITHGMTPGLWVPPKNAYGFYQGLLRDEALRAGVPPLTFKDFVWRGLRGHGDPLIKEINDAIERTHRLTGMPREGIFRRGNLGYQIPIYGGAAMAVLPADRPQAEE